LLLKNCFCFFPPWHLRLLHISSIYVVRSTVSKTV
jgi:hypothetical protein